MQVTAEHRSPCTVALSIEVDEQQVTHTLDAVYKEFSRYVSVPGFRPGKAPRAMVERYLDIEKVQRRTVERIVNETFPKAVEEEGLGLMNGINPELLPSETPVESGKTYTYNAVVSLEPVVTLGEYTGLTAERPELIITDSDVETRLNAMQQERSRLERVTDRGVEPGDTLSAETHAVEEGEENTPDSPGRRQLIQLGQNIPGFDDALFGMNVGETRMFSLTYPEDYMEESQRGKQVAYTVKLSGINTRVLPELNDEFARVAANMDSMEALRNQVRMDIEEDMQRQADEIVEETLINMILRNSTIHFPEALIHDEVEEELRQLGKELARRKISYQAFLQSANVTAEEHQERLAMQAAYKITSLLGLREIANQEGLQPTEEQIDAEFDRLRMLGTITEDQYAEMIQESKRRNHLANALVQQKLHDFLFEKNNIVTVKKDEIVPPSEADLEASSQTADPASKEEADAEPAEGD